MMHLHSSVILSMVLTWSTVLSSLASSESFVPFTVPLVTSTTPSLSLARRLTDSISRLSDTSGHGVSGFQYWVSIFGSNIACNIASKFGFNIGFNIGLDIGFNVGVQYWDQY